MKKYIAIIILFWMALPSCETFLEETPKNFITIDNFFNNYTECVSAVNGIYELATKRQGQDGNYWGAYKVGTIQTDEMQWSLQNVNQHREISFSQYAANNAIVLNLWRVSYQVIHWANACIQGIENAPITDAQKVDLLGQAKFLRALFYYNITNFFGDVPLILEPTESLEGIKVTRTSALEVYGAVIEDLKYAEINLPAKQNEKGRATRGAAQTLLAKTYMQMAGYPYLDTGKMTLAAEKLGEIVNNASAYGYALQTDYSQIFHLLNENNSEVIFDAQYEQGILGSNLTINYFGHGGNAKFGGSGSVGFLKREFHQSFKTGDLRKDRTVGNFNINAAGNRVNVNNQLQFRNAKYRADVHPVDYIGAQGPQNFIIFRYADVLLLYAEALNEVNNGPTAEAYSAINMVRRRAYGLPIDTPAPEVDLTGLDKQGFFNAVVQERSWELAGEGMRWFDLKRWQLLIDRVKATPSALPTEVIEQKHYFYPIPQSEIDVNPNLLPQNDGW
jgi:starch-binding outer membrane protein, SusD/RagB family